MQPSSKPTITCFADRDELQTAVEFYIRTCPNNSNCIVAQTYGWPMNSWCVGNVTDMSELFRDMDTFNEDISGWDTSSVMSMWSMFNGATSFNGNLSAWDTSSVTDIWGMFGRATSFKCRICSVVLHHSTKIFVHGEISFHMTKLVVSFQTLAVPIQAYPKLIRKDRFVLLIVQWVPFVWYVLFVVILYLFLPFPNNCNSHAFVHNCTMMLPM